MAKLRVYLKYFNDKSVIGAVLPEMDLQGKADDQEKDGDQVQFVVENPEGGKLWDYDSIRLQGLKNLRYPKPTLSQQNEIVPASPPELSSPFRTLLGEMSTEEALNTKLSSPQVASNIFQLFWVSDHGANDAQECLEDALRALTGGKTMGNVDVWSGLLFFADVEEESSLRATAHLSGAEVQLPIVLDKPIEVEGRLEVISRQTENRVEFLLSGEDGRRWTHRKLKGLLNVNVSDDEPALRPSDPGFVGYEIERRLGLSDAMSGRFGGLFALPKDPDGADSEEERKGLLEKKEAWLKVPLVPFDELGPSRFVGDVLDYRLKLRNEFGRVTHFGRALVKRENLVAPTPPTRAEVRLLPQENSPPKAQARVYFSADFPVEEDLELVLYVEQREVLPTGFYGDADDHSLSHARQLSDLHVGGAETAGLSSTAGGERSSEQLLDRQKLWTHGLRKVKAVALKRTDLEELRTDEEEEGENDSRLDGLVFSRDLKEEELESLVPEDASTRFFVSVRRATAGPRSPESRPVLASCTIQRREAEDEFRTVPHFERYWADTAVESSCLDETQAMFQEEAPDSAEPSTVRLVIHHAELFTGDNSLAPVGGYRIWSRDRLGPGQEVPFERKALIQVVPPLILAHQDIAEGDTWKLNSLGERPAALSVKEHWGSWVQLIKKLRGHDRQKVGYLVDKPALSCPSWIQAEADQTTKDADAEAALGAFSAAWSSSKKELESDAPFRLDQPVAEEHLGIIRARYAAARRAGCLQVEFRLSPEQQQKFGSSDDTQALKQVSAELGVSNFAQNANCDLTLFRLQNGLLSAVVWIGFPVTDELLDCEGVKAVRDSYLLQQGPSTNPTVAIDGFGDATWEYRGLKDRWRHELEWMVEPVSRYFPLQRWIENDPLKKPSNSEESEPDAAVSRLGPSPKPTAETVFRVTIQRRHDFSEKIALVPRLNQRGAVVLRVPGTTFLDRVTYNAVNRTRLGVVRLQSDVRRRFRFQKDLGGTPEGLAQFREIFSRGELPSESTASQHDIDEPTFGDFGQIVVREPHCFSIDATAWLSADGMSSLTSTELTGQVWEPLQFERELPEPVLVEESTAVSRTYHLPMPLVRLHWCWGGDVGEAERELLLPDPEAQMVLLRRDPDDEDVWSLFAAFCPKGVPEGLTPEQWAAAQDVVWKGGGETEPSQNWGKSWVAGPGASWSTEPQGAHGTPGLELVFEGQVKAEDLVWRVRRGRITHEIKVKAQESSNG